MICAWSVMEVRLQALYLSLKLPATATVSALMLASRSSRPRIKFSARATKVNGNDLKLDVAASD